MAETPNHGYNVPEEGTKDWHEPVNENFEAFEADIEIRDSGGPTEGGNDYDPVEGAKYFDTTNGVIYLGGGDSWIEAFSFDSENLWQVANSLLEPVDGGVEGVNVGEVRAELLSGTLTGGQLLSNLAGENLTIQDGSLNATASGGGGGIGSLTGGDGIDPSDIGDGDTVSVASGDLAGTYLSTDGSNNLTVDAGSGLENDGSGVLQASLGNALGFDGSSRIAVTSDSLTIAGNSVSLGGSTGIDHADLGSVNEDQHHNKDHSHAEADITAVPNSGLANSSVAVAGNSVSLGGSTGISHEDLSNIASDDHHTRPSAGSGLTDSSNTFDVTPGAFAGTYLSSDGSGNLTVDVGNGLEDDGSGALQASLGNALGFDGSDQVAVTTDSLTVAGNSVSLGGSTSISHGDLGGVSENQHHAKDHDHSEGDISTVPNAGLTNSSISVAGNSVSLGGSTVINHEDISGIASSDHHTRPSAGSGLTDSSNTFDVTPSAFAGTYLSSDGSGNLTVDVGNGLEDDGTGSLQASLGNALGFDGSNQVAVTTDSLTVAGNSVSLGGSTSISHSDLGGVSANQHHAKDHDHSESDVSLVPNAGLLNSVVTVAGNQVSLGSSTSISHSDLSSIGSTDHHVRPSAGAGLSDDSDTFNVNTPGDYLNASGTDLNFTAPAEWTGTGDNNSIPFGSDVTIAGGDFNEANGNYATIGGGENSSTNASHATVAGGLANEAQAQRTTVGGGQTNRARNPDATVGGGNGNDAGSGVSDEGAYSTIGGGQGNQTTGNHATVGGGNSNQASAAGATVSGGGGGDLQGGNVADGQNATISGGGDNEAFGKLSAIGGGRDNQANGTRSTIAGGKNNETSAVGATVGGGDDNTASGTVSTVPGGVGNIASGGTSFAAGNAAGALDTTAFVWNDGFAYHDIDGDGTDEGLSSSEAVSSEPVTGNGTFSVSATGGVRMITGSSSVTYIDAASTGWSTTSTRAAKTNIDPVDPEQALAGVEELEVATWEYAEEDGEGAGMTHIGPMAEEFHDAFDVGSSDEHINSINADGVALAAIQGLSEKLDDAHEEIARKDDRIEKQADRIDEKAERIADLEAENEHLRERNAELEDRLAAVEDHLGLDGSDTPAQGVADD